ncbi:MAG: HIT domain-containing protein [Chloroflexi bacterium]|nr:HIT domain-containing protein [Chloroflexota bacterium]
MTRCVFCDIVAGRAPASIAYEDDAVLVIMDRYPLTRGHALVLPRTHVAALPDLDEEIGMHLFRVAMRIDRALRDSSLGADAVRLTLSDGSEAGQEVPHVHMHVIPRYRETRLGATSRARSATREELDAAAQAISEAYTRLFTA